MKKPQEDKPKDIRVRLFEALKMYGIRAVRVDYDGSGDSGDINHFEVDPSKREEMLDEPLDETGKTIKEHMEQICWDGLESEESGWEINEGSYGGIEFDVKEQTITINHHERVIETVDREHEL
jgi:hypothetical protein